MDRGRLVYSSGVGRMCPDCGRAAAECRCSASQKRPTKKSAQSRPAPQEAPRDGVVRVRLETKGRKGKGVTVITGVPSSGDELTALATQLKRKCGTGGTVKDGTIEIQGDFCALVITELTQRGWTIKRAGG